MVAFHVAEVLETGFLFYNEDQTDDKGNTLPLGSVKVRLAPRDGVTNVRDVYARPMTHLISNPPLVGETLLVFNGPTEFSSPHVREQGWYYLPYTLNTTDDLANNSTPQKDFRSKKRKFSLPPKPITLDLALGIRSRPMSPLQSFAQDFVVQSRVGGAIRLGSTTKAHPQYAKQPQHHKEGKVGDANFSMTLEEAGSITPRAIAEQVISAVANLDPSLKQASQKYRIDDMSRIATGIYAGLSQKYPKLRLGRSCLPITKSIPRFNKPQIVFDSSRVVMNAKEDHAFMIAKKTAAIEGRKIHLVTNRHNVDFDTLMDNIIDLSRQVMKIATAQAPIATVMGPTGFALNFPQLIKIFLNFLRFATIPCNPLSFPAPSGKPSYDFGLNTFAAAVQDRSLQGGAGGGSQASPSQSDIAQGVGSSCSSTGTPQPESGDGTGGDGTDKCLRYEILNPGEAGLLIYRDCKGIRREKEIQAFYYEIPGICISEIIEKQGNFTLIPRDECTDNEDLEDNEDIVVKYPVDPIPTCQGFVYEFTATQQSSNTAIPKQVSYDVMLVSGKSSECIPGWYLLETPIDQETEVTLSNVTPLTDNVLADDVCLADNIKKLRCKDAIELINPTVRNKSVKVTIK